MAFLTGKYRRGVLLMGRQSGKTYFATNHAWLSAVKDQGRYFIVFKTYKQAKEVIWRQYVPLIPPEIIRYKNDTDLLIELEYIENTPFILPNGETIMVNHDKSKPRSTIQLLGSDQADSHRGFRAHGIIFDEYADQDPDVFAAVYEPMFTTTNGWAIFMGTPRGYNHFYDLIMDAQTEPDWFFQKATWRDSPYVLREAIDRAKKDAERKGTLASFMQEYELEFRSIQGAVYPDFNRDIHVVPAHEMPSLDGMTLYAGIDFGWHTTACILVGIDKDQNWWIFDEIYGHEQILNDILPIIKARLTDKRLVLMVGDSANRDAIEMLGKHFPIVGINKSLDTAGYSLGISLVTEKLKPRTQIVGAPKPSMYISSTCKEFIQELEAYKFPEEKKDRNPSDVPVKENDHGPDALRYLALHLKYGTINSSKPISTGLKFNEYGL
jgi:phage terminase large subunit